MAGDIDELIGKWAVPVRQWVWEYVFLPDGKVTWRDTRSQEKGTGRWSATPKLVNVGWSDSATAESWHRPITPGRQKGWYSASHFTGNYEVQEVVPAAPRGATDVDPSVAKLPWERCVDAYVSVHDDINYEVSPTKSFAFSSILRATYNDGVVVEFDIDTDFSTAPMSLDQARDLIAHAKVGRSGRIEPAVLNFATTPNLWRARADAPRDQDVEANAFVGMAITATAFVLSTPAMPAGAMTEAAAMPKNVMRRTLPATKASPARAGPAGRPSATPTTRWCSTSPRPCRSRGRRRAGAAALARSGLDRHRAAGRRHRRLVVAAHAR